MFKFDNAFLTCNKRVGLQFIDHSITDKHGAKRMATVYPDKKGHIKVDCSLQEPRQHEYVFLIEQYNKKAKYYHHSAKGH